MFEVFLNGRAKTDAPMATLQRAGRILLNHEAVQQLGDPRAAELLYSKDEQAVMIRPAESENAYPLRPFGSGAALITAVAFCQHYGIDTSVSRRYLVHIEEGAAVIHLGEPVGAVSRASSMSPPIPDGVWLDGWDGK